MRAIGLVTAASALMAALGDIHRFPTSPHLVGYLGLHPKVRQSGSGPARHEPNQQAGIGRGPAGAHRGRLGRNQSTRPAARFRVFATTLIRGSNVFATDTVSSVQWSSTRITSCTHSGMSGSTCGRFSASFSAGTTTVTVATPPKWSVGAGSGVSTGAAARPGAWCSTLTYSSSRRACIAAGA